MKSRQRPASRRHSMAFGGDSYFISADLSPASVVFEITFAFPAVELRDCLMAPTSFASFQSRADFRRSLEYLRDSAGVDRRPCRGKALLASRLVAGTSRLANPGHYCGCHLCRSLQTEGCSSLVSLSVTSRWVLPQDLQATRYLDLRWTAHSK